MNWRNHYHVALVTGLVVFALLVGYWSGKETGQPAARVTLADGTNVMLTRSNAQDVLDEQKRIVEENFQESELE